MPPLFADIDRELLIAHHQLVALVAGPIGEEIFLRCA